MNVSIIASGQSVDRGARHLLEYTLGATPSSKERNLSSGEISERRRRFAAIYAEALAREDAGVGSLWTPQSSNRRRPSSLLCVAPAISLPTFAFECESLAASHPSLTRGILHYVFSVGIEETKTLSDDRLVRAVRAVLDDQDVALAGHLMLLVCHRDTDNLHCHSAVSAVSTVTGKTCRRASSLRALSFACRRAEVRFGLMKGKGSAVVGGDGNVRWCTPAERAEWRQDRAKARRRARAERQADRERGAAIERLRNSERSREQQREQERDRGIDRGLER